MPVQHQTVHPNSLDLFNQRKVWSLRKEGMGWADIASSVENLQGEPTSEQNAKNVYTSFSKRKSVVKKHHYDKCGRKAWKLTTLAKRFLLKKLLALRTKCICTSTTLQSELAREMSIKLDASKIRQHLRESGYRWLPRCQKRKYSKEVMEERMAFCRKVLRMTLAELRIEFALSIDGGGSVA